MQSEDQFSYFDKLLISVKKMPAFKDYNYFKAWSS